MTERLCEECGEPLKITSNYQWKKRFCVECKDKRDIMAYHRNKKEFKELKAENSKLKEAHGRNLLEINRLVSKLEKAREELAHYKQLDKQAQTTIIKLFKENV